MLGPGLLCLLLLPLAGTQEAASCSPLAASCSPLAASCSPLAASCSPLAASCSPLAASLQCSSPDTWATLQCRHAAAPGPCTLVANHHR